MNTQETTRQMHSPESDMSKQTWQTPTLVTLPMSATASGTEDGPEGVFSIGGQDFAFGSTS